MNTLIDFFKRLLMKVYNQLRTRVHRKIVCWLPLNVNISKKANVSIKERFSFNIPWNLKSKCTLGDLLISESGSVDVRNVRFYSGCKLAVYGSFSMGSGYVNNNSKIFCRNKITIGENVVIAPEVIIRDSDQHHIIDTDGTTKQLSAPISIGNHVWIGTRAIILKGVTIGNNVVVAAGAVVTRDIPDNCLVAGVPAKVVKKGISWK